MIKVSCCIRIAILDIVTSRKFVLFFAGVFMQLSEKKTVFILN